MKDILANNKYNGYRIVIAAILASVIFVCQIMEKDSIVSFCFALSIVMVVLNYAWTIASTKKISLDIVVLLVLMLFSFVSSGLRLDFEFYKRAIIVLCCLFCLNGIKDLQLSVKQVRIIELSFVLAAGYAIYMYYWGGLDKVYFGTTDSISLNFSNPNACGMWLTTFLISFVIFFFIEKKIYIRIPMAVLALSLFPVIDATESRNSWLACALFVVAVVAFKILRIKALPHVVLMIMTALPLIVFYVYMYIVIPHIDLFEQWFSFLIEDGKNLLSRKTIWQKVVDDFRSCFWFGKYGAYYNEQMHNSLMTVYCMFGGAFTFYTCKVFYQLMKRLDIFAQLTLVAVWFTGCFEASFFVGVAGLYLMLEILPVIAKRNSFANS